MDISCDNTARLMYQYQDSPRMRDLMLTLTNEYCALGQVQVDMMTRLDVDTSVGMQLDLIGVIVGAPRPLTEQLGDEESFVFDDPEGEGPWAGAGLGWSGVGRGDIGGRFVGTGGLLVGAMSDIDYRTLIRARIFSNRSKGTVDEINEFLQYVLGPGGHYVEVSSTQAPWISIHVDHNLTSTETAILELLTPVAAGAEFRAIIEP